MATQSISVGIYDECEVTKLPNQLSYITVHFQVLVFPALAVQSADTCHAVSGQGCTSCHQELSSHLDAEGLRKMSLRLRPPLPTDPPSLPDSTQVSAPDSSRGRH